MENISDELIEWFLENVNSSSFQWIMNNPVLAFKEKPELKEFLGNAYNKRNPKAFALLFQSIPKFFPEWKTDIEKYDGLTKQKHLKKWADTYKLILFEYECVNEIDKTALDSVRPELMEQMQYFEKELLKHQLKTVKPKMIPIDELIKNQVLEYELSLTKPIKSINPESFQEIFVNGGWEKYISALQKTEPKLMSDKNEFIGKPRLHKGAVCSWFKHLQTKSIINQRITRSQLATVLNKEFKNFNVGTDGKTFDNVSSSFRDEFEKQLTNLVK